ncbi:MAG: alpha/beta hydrolase fold domain-containing protein [Fuerstiella sp.]
MKSCLRIIVMIMLSCRSGVGEAQQNPDRTFRQWDVDKNGKLTRDELPDSARRNFDRADANDDGVISLQEHVEFLARRQRREKNGLPPGVIVDKDLAYVKDGHERQLLDLYRPIESDGPAPVVIWIHGGAWRAGSKDSCPAIPLVSRGFVVASINYRLSGQATFPAQIHDCKAALRWLRTNSKQLGIDPQRFGVWGSSAGGHLAALLGTSGGVAALEGELGHQDASSRVQAVCDWFGPIDLLLMNQQAGDLGTLNHDAPNSPESLLLGGTLPDVPEKAKIASPLTYVSEDDPEFLIVHGDQDPLVSWKQSQLLHDALSAAGVRSDFTIIRGAGHGRFADPAITEASLSFFERVLGPERTTRKR